MSSEPTERGGHYGVTLKAEVVTEPTKTREVPEGYWQWDREHFPDPVSPMTVSLELDSSWMKPAFKSLCEDLGLPFEGIDLKLIGGYPYMRIVPPGGKDRSPPPAWIMPLLIKIVPQVRSSIRRSVEAVRTHKHSQYVKSWYDDVEPSLNKRTRQLLQTNLREFSDVQ